MIRLTKTAWCAAVVGLLAAAASAAEPTGGPGAAVAAEVLEFPHAGVALSFPAGYRSQTVAGPYDIARAILLDKDQPVQAVTVAAFPLDDPNLTAEQLADEMVAAQRQNLAVRNLEELSKAAMKVADQPGSARLLSYTFRGEPTVAASVVFCRTLGEGKGRLEYVVTVEAAADRKAEVLPTLGEVVKSVRLMTVVRPIDIPIKDAGLAVEPASALYALRVPRGWFAEAEEVAVSLAQTDYLAGGEPTLSACVLVADANDMDSPEQHTERCIAAATQTAAEQGMIAEVVDHGPAKLGGAEGQQLVIEQRLAPAAASEPATAPATAAASAPTSAEAATAPASAPAEPGNVVIVQRSVVVAPAADKPAQRLSLVLVCVDAKPAAATAAMEKLAEGFILRAAATSMPASQPTTVPSAPAATRPAEISTE